MKAAFKQLAVLAFPRCQMMSVIVSVAHMCSVRVILTVEQTNKNGQMSYLLGHPYPRTQASILSNSTEIY